MRSILVIGIGAGDPNYMTVGAIAALNRAEVILLPDKGEEKSGLNAVRSLILGRFATRPHRVASFAVPERRVSDTAYAESIEDWRARLEAAHAEVIARELPEGGTGAFLVWGDPAIYDGTIGLLYRLKARLDLAVEVFPGISAVQSLAARHGIALNGTGEAIHITTGRRLAAEGLVHDNTVVMLDSRDAYLGCDPGARIWWGAYLGTPDEILISGTIGEVGTRIAEMRAAARARHGWIMDTYLIRRG
jgi:precorrin-6A synthase